MTGDLFAPAPASAFPPPREFQERAHRELRAGVAAGHRKQVLMAPTGAGKTYLALRICNEALARGRRALFVCDRKTLINQTSATADRYGMPVHGIIQADNPRWAPHRAFQIASAQTLQARGGCRDEFEVVVIDECHTQYDATRKLVESSSAQAIIGLSATPFSKGLGQLYGRVVNAATMHELVGSGVLTPFRAFSCVRPDMAGAKTSGGEWTMAEAAQRGMGLVGDVVTEWMRHADGRKTICFGSRVDHCEALVRQFKAAGIEAALFTAHTTDAEREDLLADYRQPEAKTRVLVSVEALAKGFDVPDVSCVIDCRPLRKSLSTFVQMLGRGLRSAPGKEDCVLLDHSGNVIRFADDFSRVYFDGLAQLDAGEALDREVREDVKDREGKACPSCGRTPMGRRCVGCGFEPVRVSLVEHDAGEAREINPLGNAAKYARTTRELWEMIATVERDRVAAKGRGNAAGSTAHLYRDLTGSWPPRGWDVATAPSRPPTVALDNKLRSIRIAYARRARR